MTDKTCLRETDFALMTQKIFTIEEKQNKYDCVQETVSKALEGINLTFARMQSRDVEREKNNGRIALVWTALFSGGGVAAVMFIFQNVVVK